MEERGQEGGGRVVRTVGSSQLLSLGGCCTCSPPGPAEMRRPRHLGRRPNLIASAPSSASPHCPIPGSHHSRDIVTLRDCLCLICLLLIQTSCRSRQETTE